MVTPVRILDTRDPTNLGLAGPFVSTVSQKLQVAGMIPTSAGVQAVVPAGSTGVLLNATLVRPQTNGYLSVRPGDATGAPATSSVNNLAGVTVANAVTVALPLVGVQTGRIDITWTSSTGTAGATTEVLIDVVGYTTYTALDQLQEAVANLTAQNAAQDTLIRNVLLDTAAIPTGATVTGYGTFDHSIVVDNEDIFVAVPLPGVAPVALSETTVNFAPSTQAADDDATCTGSASNPTAPSGKVCIYLLASSGIEQARGWHIGDAAMERRYFHVQFISNGTPGQDVFIRFVWAYHAP